jgi:soluble lytic murein transglycosylase-like protein
MRWLAWVLGGVVGGVGLIAMTKKANASDLVGFDALFQHWAAVYGVDWRLVKAHAMRESSLDAYAVNEADPSYGLGQVLCDAASPDSPCRNKLNVDGWSQATPNRLLNPDFNIRIATQIIAANIRQYGLPRAIAVYNRFAEHASPLNGPFQNQAYVDDVLRIYGELGGVL